MLRLHPVLALWSEGERSKRVNEYVFRGNGVLHEQRVLRIQTEIAKDNQT
jgi:hypothetical protein